MQHEGAVLLLHFLSGTFKDMETSEKKNKKSTSQTTRCPIIT